MSSSVPPRSRPLPDRASVQRLLGDDAALAGQLIDLLAVEAPRLLAQLQQATAAGQLREVARQAHTLRGMLGNFGAHSACEAAEVLEQHCRQEQPQLLAAASGQLRAEVEAVLGALC